MTHHNFDSLFQKVVSNPFSNLKIDEFKEVALYIWYQNSIPNASHFNSFEKQKAGYLIERLMRYNCVPKCRKLELLQLVNTLKNQLKPEITNSKDNFNAEPLAIGWGLSEDVSLMMSDLLQYQTRHYKQSATN